MAEARPDRRVCVGVIAGAHGVRGQLRVESFTRDPMDLTAYGPITDATGARCFDLMLTGRAKGMLLARIEGIDDREGARALHGTQLYVARAALPEPGDEEEYYHADLIGLSAEDGEGKALGRVVAVHNYGAGDVIEIEGPEGTSLLVPFTKAVVPFIDLVAGRLVVEPPAEVVAKPE